MGARVRVKICGITNREDATAAVALGADALGFNLFAGSKRCIDLDAHAAWIAALPPFVAKVAVVVNASLDEARRLAQNPAIDLVQFHGDEDAEYCASFSRFDFPFIKVLRLRNAADIDRAAEFSTPHVLIDAHVEGAYGGTGTNIDLTLAEEFVRRNPALNVILAGGLTPENVGQAARIVRPFAVDVSSGVETEPRRKNAARMEAFVEAVKKG